jgi:hypothetical protein
MPALVAGIHVFRAAKTWMAGTTPGIKSVAAMTNEHGFRCEGMNDGKIHDSAAWTIAGMDSA